MKALVIAALAFSAVSYSQTTDFCAQAQELYNQGKYKESMSAVGRAIVKDPDAKCRQLRVDAAMRGTPTAEMYVVALTDLEYMINRGDKSEKTYNAIGVAEAGIAAELYKNRDYANAKKHYGVAKEAYQKAKTVSGNASYDQKIRDTETSMQQAQGQSKP